jgi:ADP-dependent NAD(P)H-hydrate dehydratase / NAD(P)H-hydrate epimerase
VIHQDAWILQASQQRALDDASIGAGTSAASLMESAGFHASEWILERLHPRIAVILAGPGGNGGDAFVVARHLFQAGVAVHIFCRSNMEACGLLTRTMAKQLVDLDSSIHILPLDHATLADAVNTADCVIDGLFGSGLSRSLTDVDAATCRLLNASDTTTISLDVPSGVASDTGADFGPAVRADVTLAMAFYKPCHWLYPAAVSCGEVQIVGVDYPAAELAKVLPTAIVPNRKSISAMLPNRPPTGHKGSFGHVLVVAGSQGMTGAAILCARGALRAGAGLVTVALPETIAPVIQGSVPEAMTLLLPDREGRLVDPALLEGLLPAMQRADVIAIGPGLGRDSATLEIVRRILKAAKCGLVIDADAIHALVGHEDLLASLSGRALLTPHPGEFAALVGSQSRDVDAQRLDRVAALSAEHRIHLVLKGRPTVIGIPDNPLIVNPTGNTGLATGGSGDVLTGLMAGLLASGSSPDEAAVIAPYIHGLAADRWTLERSERALTPSDILEDLPRLLKELES